MRKTIIKFSMLIPVKLRQKREKKTNNVVTILQLLRLLSTLKHEFLFIMVLLMCVLNLDYFILNCMYTSLVSLQLTTTSSTTQLFIPTYCYRITRCTFKVKYYLYSFYPMFSKAIRFFRNWFHLFATWLNILQTKVHKCISKYFIHISLRFYFTKIFISFTLFFGYYYFKLFRLKIN